MTLLSHRKKFLYIKTTKTASTSIEAYFQPYCYPRGQVVNITDATDGHQGETGVVASRLGRQLAGETT